MFKPKMPQQNQGFTLVEVLVAILITTLFIGVTMQAMVFAAVFKVKAQEYAEATNWIQEDLENVKYQASNLQLLQTTLASTALASASSISINTPNANTDIINSFTVNDTLKVGLDPIKYKITGVSGTGTGSTATRTLTITPNLTTDQLLNAAVVATKMCNPSTRNLGLADALRDSITDTDPSNGITNITSNDNYIDSDPPRRFRTGKYFTMRKTTTLSANSPYNVLQVKYEVSSGTTFNSAKTIANFDTEVIPNVAFQCP